MKRSEDLATLNGLRMALTSNPHLTNLARARVRAAIYRLERLLSIKADDPKEQGDGKQD